jgi:hypothetical protein
MSVAEVTGRAALEALNLTPGCGLVLDGVAWQVESVEPQHGRVLLRGEDGQRRQATIRWLLHHPGRRGARPDGLASTAQGRQVPVMEDLTPTQQEQLRLRVAHLLEAETGFRSGDPRQALPGEPRPAYDPAITTLGERRRAKEAELRKLGRDEARMLGLAEMSERTLERLAATYQRVGIIGCIDGRWLRRSGGHPSVSEELREAIDAVHVETLHRSKVSMRTRERLIHQYVREKFGSETPIPHYDTLRVVWAEWFGSGGARQRYARSAAAVAPINEHVVVHRPGQIVALDTTPLPVKVREHLFGDPVSVYLTLALDVYTHSLVAFRLTLVSDTSVDVAMLLRDITMPLPLHDGWGEDMEWPYPGIPAAVVAEFAGHRVAGLPFFTPETITTDHGAVYKNHHLVEVQRVLGCNVLPARVLRPTDRQTIERAFGVIRSLLFELLLGYQGVDVADRGVDPEADAVLTVTAMEHLIASWIVKIWQNRQLGEHAPAWDPGGKHSPNTLFAAAMGQGGFALQVPMPELYYQLLPVHQVKIHRRGVKILGLWYSGRALDPYRNQPSARGGRHKGMWLIRRDPRDRRFVFFQDPTTHAWHRLRWTGLPEEGEVPAFSDARAEELLAEARWRGLKPRSDAELLPLLLELLGGCTTVEQWPTQRARSSHAKQRPEPKRRRIARAREAAQTAAAAHDRPHEAKDASGGAGDANVVPLDRDEHARQVQEAIDSERRRRREQAVPVTPPPPPRLGETARRRSLLLLPPDDAEDLQGGVGPPETGEERCQ